MTILSRMLKLRRITVDMTPGADPDAIDDAGETYGDWPEVVDRCFKNSKTGQHEYSRDYFDFGRCLHCHQPSGLDR